MRHGVEVYCSSWQKQSSRWRNGWVSLSRAGGCMSVLGCVERTTLPHRLALFRQLVGVLKKSRSTNSSRESGSYTSGPVQGLLRPNRERPSEQHRQPVTDRCLHAFFRSISLDERFLESLSPGRKCADSAIRGITEIRCCSLDRSVSIRRTTRGWFTERGDAG